MGPPTGGIDASSSLDLGGRGRRGRACGLQQLRQLQHVRDEVQSVRDEVQFVRDEVQPAVQAEVQHLRGSEVVQPVRAVTSAA